MSDTEKDVTPKEEVKEEAPVEEKAESKKEPVKKKQVRKKQTPKKKTKFVHIDDFIEAISIHESLSSAKANGFKAYMTGNHYAKSLDDFIPHLEKYLNKKVGK